MFNAIVSGVITGSIYGLFAVGLILAYRATKVVNLAYGEIGLVGAFAFIAARSAGAPLVLAIAAGLATGAVLGGATEYLVVRPAARNPLRAMIGTFGVGALLTTWAGWHYGTSPIYVNPIVTGQGYKLGSAHVSDGQLFLLSGVAAITVAYLAYGRGPAALRDRAVANDAFAAAQSGINVNLTRVRAWALAGAVAAASGIMIAPLETFSVYLMTSLLFRGLVAALLVGFRNPSAAFGAGVLIGVTEGIVSYESTTPALIEAVLAIAAIGILLLRPPWLEVDAV
jgi:branched-chain amino acid transport system permease protein